MNYFDGIKKKSIFFLCTFFFVDFIVIDVSGGWVYSTVDQMRTIHQPYKNQYVEEFVSLEFYHFYYDFFRIERFLLLLLWFLLLLLLCCCCYQFPTDMSLAFNCLISRRSSSSSSSSYYSTLISCQLPAKLSTLNTFVPYICMIKNDFVFLLNSPESFRSTALQFK